MTKVLAKGVVESLSLRKPEGKTYNVADLVVAGKSFKGIYKGARGVAMGMSVEIVEHPAPPGRSYGDKEIVLSAGAPQAAAPAAQTQPARGYGRDPSEQDRIMRQWATSQAICFVNLARESGALTKTAMGSEVTLQQLVGKYANFYFNAVQTGAGFEKMPQFTGEINEVSEQEV